MPEGKSDDLMEAARKLCDDLIQAWLLHHSREEAAEIAVQAILAERQRCATLAMEAASNHGWDYHVPTLGRAIAGRIMDHSPSTEENLQHD